MALGMLVAGIFNCVFNIARNYRFHWHMGLDSILHASVSLYGIYLVRTGRARLDKKTCLIGGAFMWVVAGCMLLLNVIFHTAFFGLSVYGEHNIYGVVLSDSGVVSAVIYFVGMTIVLALGTLYQWLVNGRRIKRVRKEKRIL